ncbi:hypothetical protein ACOSP7_009812 [Xanthoceras sorbifolium]|uniref:Retrotransposon gag domain-containing protein n=1 Tax=Xanthoceras sorbifolium TaxID=99658 RepID=A0ABQ8HU93_9ROSI|nr:hypothetical protein JRO89_XS07G0187500 [Xanthoceras sorbifolium]
MCWIYSALTPRTTSYIVSYGTAYEIWEALSKRFESTSTARIFGLRSQLTNLKKEGMTVSQYLFQFKEITDKFAAIGEPLSYRDHLGYVLDGLGPEYDAFVTSIENRVDRPSIEDVESLMLSHESRLSKRNTIEQLNFAQANMASYHGNKKYQKPFQPNFHKSFQLNSPQSRPMSPQFLNKNSNQFSQFNNTMPSILGKPQNQMFGPKW